MSHTYRLFTYIRKSQIFQCVDVSEVW